MKKKDNANTGFGLKNNKTQVEQTQKLIANKTNMGFGLKTTKMGTTNTGIDCRQEILLFLKRSFFVSILFLGQKNHKKEPRKNVVFFLGL